MEILKQAIEAYKQLRPAYEVPPINKVFMDFENGILEVNGERIIRPIVIETEKGGWPYRKLLNSEKLSLDDGKAPVLRLDFTPGTGRQIDVFGFSDSIIAGT